MAHLRKLFISLDGLRPSLINSLPCAREVEFRPPLEPPLVAYHLSVKTISRADGRSAVAAAAYRSATCLYDVRTGRTADYTLKQGVVSTQLFGWNGTREELWQAAESAERRGNSRVAREVEIALPAQLPAPERERLAHELAEWLVDRYQVAVDVAIHKPSRKGDQRNHHAHVLFTTRQVEGETFGAKTRILDDKITGPEEVEAIRRQWSQMCQAIVDRPELWDHRSYERQGIDKTPTVHLGPAASAMTRRGHASDRGSFDREIERDELEIEATRSELRRAEERLEQLRQEQQRQILEEHLQRQQKSNDDERVREERSDFGPETAVEASEPLPCPPDHPGGGPRPRGRDPEDQKGQNERLARAVRSQRVRRESRGSDSGPPGCRKLSGLTQGWADLADSVEQVHQRVGPVARRSAKRAGRMRRSWNAGIIDWRRFWQWLRERFGRNQRQTRSSSPRRGISP